MDPIEFRLQRLEEQGRRTQRALDELRSAGVFHIREHSVIVESLSASALVATNAAKVLVSAAAPAVVTWVPTTTQSTALMTQVNRAGYYISDSEVSGAAGKVVHIWCNLTVLATGTAGNPIIISGWPAAINPYLMGTFAQVGTGGVYRSGVTYYPALPGLYGSVTAIRFWWQPTGNLVGVDPSFALASGDEIYLNAAWEIA